MQRARHFGSDAVLQVEEVVDVTVDPARPDVVAGLGLDQLRRDPHPLADPPDAAFHRIAHPEFAADLADIDRPALIGKGRIAGDDEEVADAGEGCGYLLDHSIGEIGLVGLAR